ncbi:hypothetical protein BGX31_008205 [Mortierella sp. GBA43]|nr:hypothetical protein BGX31_008205 [Mortierella sp. GBA43]
MTTEPKKRPRTQDMEPVEDSPVELSPKLQIISSNALGMHDQTTSTTYTVDVVTKEVTEEIVTESTADKDTDSVGDSENSKAEGSRDAKKRKPDDDTEYETKLSKAERKLLKKKNKEFTRKSEGDGGRPCFMLSRNYNRLNIKDVRDLVLYLLTETKTLPWIMVKNKFNIHKTVLLHIPGFDPQLFNVNAQHPDADKPIAWTEKATRGPVTELRHMRTFFDVMNVMKVGGDKTRIFPPVETLLSVPLSNSEKAKRDAERKSKKKSAATLTPENYMITVGDFKEYDFPLPSYLDPERGLQKDWVETQQRTSDSTTPKKMIAMDCEMVLTTAGSELARISLVDENKAVVLDELVKPDNRIVDYLTQYSGITAEGLKNVSTKLTDVQEKLQKLITHDTILVGHSLENDLKVLKFAHPFIIDTTVIYHHTRGPPFRPSLKWLAYKWLSKEIQNGRQTGHDSVEDACACMDLVKLKLHEGPGFGEYNQDSQSIFTRLARNSAPRRSAAIDSETVPGETFAATVIKAKTDEEVTKGVTEAISNHNFVWARLTAMEINHGKRESLAHKDEDGIGSQMLDPASSTSATDEHTATDDEIREAMRRIDNSVAAIVDALPANAALIVTSGEGDTREVQRLQERQKRFQKLYSTVQLSSIPKEDQFLDEDQKLLHKAVDRAKNGVCFFMVK